jgi:uncharacterized protein
MIDRIPQRIDCFRYTDKGVTLKGVITQEESLKSMPRIHQAVEKSLGDVYYNLTFELDDFSNRVVRGSVENKVVLQCQRCMNDFTLDLKCTIATAFVRNDVDIKNAEQSGYDIFWLEQKELLDPRILIEEELLLALPQIPKHSDTNINDSKSVCRIKLDYPVDEELENKLVRDEPLAFKNSGQMEEDNPFAVLKQLKK